MNKPQPLTSKTTFNNGIFAEQLSSPSLVASKNEKNIKLRENRSEPVEVPKHIETEINNTIREIENQILNDEKALETSSQTRSTIQIKSPSKEVLRTPKKSEMAYFGLPVTPPPQKKNTGNKFIKNPKLDLRTNVSVTKSFSGKSDDVVSDPEIFENQYLKETPNKLKIHSNARIVQSNSFTPRKSNSINTIHNNSVRNSSNQNNIISNNSINMTQTSSKEKTLNNYMSTAQSNSADIVQINSIISNKSLKPADSNIYSKQSNQPKSLSSTRLHETQQNIESYNSFRNTKTKLINPDLKPDEHLLQENKLSEKPDLLQFNQVKNKIAVVNTSHRSELNKPKETRKVEANKLINKQVDSNRNIKRIEVKQAKRASTKEVQRTPEAIYENVDKKLSRKEFDSSILEELTKAADQIMLAVNGFAEEDNLSRRSTSDEERRRNSLRREPLETISETKSWKQTNGVKKPEVKSDLARSRVRRTSSNSSIESVTRECR